MNKTSLTVSQIRGFLLVAPKSEVRFYLTGLFIDFGNGKALATDGHALIGLRLDTKGMAAPNQSSVIIPRDALDTISKGGKTTDIVLIEFDGIEGITLARETIDGAKGVSIAVKRVDGTFPDCDRVIPDKASGEFHQVNPELLAKVSKAVTLLEGYSVNGRNQPAYIPNGDSAGIVAYPAGDAIGVVMPWRQDAPDADYAGTWKRGKQAAAA